MDEEQEDTKESTTTWFALEEEFISTDLHENNFVVHRSESKKLFEKRSLKASRGNIWYKIKWAASKTMQSRGKLTRNDGFSRRNEYNQK